MRDIFKKLRCRGGNEEAAAKCEDNKDKDDKGDNETNEEVGETEKLLNGDEKKGEEEEKEEIAEDNEEQKEETKEDDEVEEEKKEDEGKEEDVMEDANEEGDSLIENSEDKGVKKCEKKTKKKEPSKWMCGLGKKSSSEKGKKKKEDGKQCKKDERNEEENEAKEEMTEETNGEEKRNGNEVEEKEENESEAAKEEEEQDGDENDTTSQNVEEKVVVFVTESEAVGSETADESKEECFVRGDGLIKATKDKTASFEIHGPEEPHFECKIRDQNGNEVAVEMERLGENQQKATYCPDTVGVHVIEATWKGSQVLGSPFQVQVEASESS